MSNQIDTLVDALIQFRSRAVAIDDHPTRTKLRRMAQDLIDALEDPTFNRGSSDWEEED